MRQGAANRDVHEQQPQRGVLESWTRLQIVELPREQQRGDGHRAGLGDERAEQRRDDEDRHPPGGRCGAPHLGDPPQDAFGQLDDRPRRGQGHDDDHEQRLREVDAVVQIVRRRFPAAIDADCNQQRRYPQPEDDLDLPEKMEQLRPDARDCGQCFRGARRVMLRLQPVCEVGNAGGHERVDHGEQKNRGRDEVERLDLDSCQEDVDKSAASGVRICR